MSLNRTQIVDWLYRCGDIFTKQSDFLTGLDKEIGDADHGLNMHRGFSKVVEKLPSIADKDIGFILKNTGMTLLSNVGAALSVRTIVACENKNSIVIQSLLFEFCNQFAHISI